MLRNQAGSTRFLGSFPGALPEVGLPEIAFAGRSNVGKSSGINCLLGGKHARVSATPGRTQAINLFQLGEAAVFADLPGYGYAKVPDAVRDAWKPMVEHYLKMRADLRLVVVWVDARREPQGFDGQLLATLGALDVPALVVATKIDKLTKRERAGSLTALRRELGLPDGDPIPFSAVTREGRNEVWERLEEVLPEPSTPTPEPR